MKRENIAAHAEKIFHVLWSFLSRQRLLHSKVSQSRAHDMLYSRGYNAFIHVAPNHRECAARCYRQRASRSVHTINHYTFKSPRTLSENPWHPRVLGESLDGRSVRGRDSCNATMSMAEACSSKWNMMCTFRRSIPCRRSPKLERDASRDSERIQVALFAHRPCAESSRSTYSRNSRTTPLTYRKHNIRRI